MMMLLLGQIFYIESIGAEEKAEKEIKATGTGLPPDKAKKRAEKCAYAERAAEIDARGRLLEQITTGITTAAANEGFTLSKSDITSYAQGALIGSEIVETKEIGECESVKVTVKTQVDLKEAAKKIATSRTKP
jgi:hypothetical protein